jgi:ABC-type multidrug transport system ATPase subunit
VVSAQPLLRGRTVILVTHHLELLLPGTDYLVQINDGRIEAQGTPAELREKGILARLTALEEATLENHEAILTREDIDKEVVAVEVGAGDGQAKDAKKGKTPRKLVQDEDRATGHVEW